MTDIASLKGYDILPEDGTTGALVGRVWRPQAAGKPGGPSVVAIRESGVFDITDAVPTVAELLDRDDAIRIVREHPGERLASLERIVTASSAPPASAAAVHLLAPIDLQAVKAAGVTFALQN